MTELRHPEPLTAAGEWSVAPLVESLLDGAIAAGHCPGLRGAVASTGEVLPAQYLLLARGIPAAQREGLRRAALGLLELLDAADRAAAHADSDDCARFHALAAAPHWLLFPSDPDDTDVDVALICERELDHGGSWHALLAHLHRAGTEEWQWAIQRCRALMRFETQAGRDLADLLGIHNGNSTEGRVST